MSMKLESVLEETRVFPPSAAFAAKARVNADKLAALRAAAEADPVGFWADLARHEIAWQTPFRTALDDSAAPNYRWFVDGKTNASANCLDRHLGLRGDKVAIRFEGERGDTKNWTYRA
ncbi:MAG TPA: acetyl-coenzyme A synthetase N-terminal domain-containing protein, partial [Nevskiaceae bacterium]|nr:acetyl-coenzyme A synthetase N-terminal domain-containing protein [Nevskiaceae bacterium]